MAEPVSPDIKGPSNPGRRRLLRLAGTGVAAAVGLSALGPLVDMQNNTNRLQAERNALNKGARERKINEPIVKVKEVDLAGKQPIDDDSLKAKNALPLFSEAVPKLFGVYGFSSIPEVKSRDDRAMGDYSVKFSLPTTNDFGDKILIDVETHEMIGALGHSDPLIVTYTNQSTRAKCEISARLAFIGTGTFVKSVGETPVNEKFLDNLEYHLPFVLGTAINENIARGNRIQVTESYRPPVSAKAPTA